MNLNSCFVLIRSYLWFPLSSDTVWSTVRNQVVQGNHLSEASSFFYHYCQQFRWRDWGERKVRAFELNGLWVIYWKIVIWKNVWRWVQIFRIIVGEIAKCIAFYKISCRLVYLLTMALVLTFELRFASRLVVSQIHMNYLQDICDICWQGWRGTTY